MSDLFILGAGFSMAVDGLAMPSMESLGNQVLALMRAKHDTGPATVHTDRCDGLSCDDPLLVDGKIPAPSFEAWLSKLATSQPYLLDQDNDRNTALYREITGLVASVIQLAMHKTTVSKNPPEWLSNLIVSWHERRVDVLTFNYDTLVESTLLAESRYGRALYGKTTWPIPPYIVPSHLPMGSAASTFRFRKLHGSLAWYWDERTRSSESMVDVGIAWSWMEGPRDLEDRLVVPGKGPVIIPPTAGKNPFLGNTTLRFLWRDSFEALRAADRVFVLGYSLPPEDLLVQSMLIDACHAKPKSAWIVNPDAEVVDRFRRLAVMEIANEFVRPEEPIPDFVEWYGRNLDAFT